MPASPAPPCSRLVAEPSAFDWESWYAAAGGRTIAIPEVDEFLRRIREEQEPRFTGPLAVDRTAFGSPAAAARHLKDKATEFGADIVGICAIEPSDVYRGRSVTERFAIAVGQRMRWREFQEVPSRASAIECLRVYYTLGETVIQLADHIRSLGYACQVEHPIGDSDLLHIPIGLKAGFGELGRHGSIIHPRLGPLFRMGSVATSIELEIDHPIDAGIAKFCDTCLACRKYCPPQAIPDQRSPEAGQDHLGYDRYVVDTGRCFPYFAKHSYCSICLPVCVYNHKEWARDFDGHATKLFPAVRMPPAPPAAEPAGVPLHFYPHLRR
jgi:epoxyqueuosine reductase